jgi:hypothetical protein
MAQPDAATAAASTSTMDKPTECRSRRHYAVRRAQVWHEIYNVEKFVANSWKTHCASLTAPPISRTLNKI